MENSSASKQLSLTVPDRAGTVSALLLRPPQAQWLYLLAHGAGAGMRHPFLAGIAERLAARGVASLRYQFPYMEAGRRRPDAAATLEATVRAAVELARQEVGLPVIAGGKSLGGRMTSSAASREALKSVIGLAFLGFPLHPPRQPGSRRGEHLQNVPLPMLFVQGTRDALAELALVKQVVGSLGARATLHLVEGGDHSFEVPRHLRRSRDEVLDDIGEALCRWGAGLVAAA